ncbi:uncharacterized protein LOC134278281 [Saccostrea cucullata]|uniref:uncharacterized protein LOC134278281 n=1 Tax=Saccostrea cuccullata TaxID=36930 RepID=UPI002ED444D5
MTFSSFIFGAVVAVLLYNHWYEKKDLGEESILSSIHNYLTGKVMNVVDYIIWLFSWFAFFYLGILVYLGICACVVELRWNLLWVLFLHFLYNHIQQEMEKYYLKDQEGENREINSHYSYIIVGAGTAGCVLANRLSEDLGSSVLIVEAGGSEDEHEMMKVPSMARVLQTTKHDWNFRTVQQKFRCHNKKDRVSEY